MFPKEISAAADIKSRLERILDQQMQERRQLGLGTPDSVELILSLDKSDEFGYAHKLGNDRIIQLNPLIGLSREYMSLERQWELEEIDVWIDCARDLIYARDIRESDIASAQMLKSFWMPLYVMLMNPESIDHLYESLDQPTRRKHEASYWTLAEGSQEALSYYVNALQEVIGRAAWDSFREIIDHELDHLDPIHDAAHDWLITQQREIYQMISASEKGQAVSNSSFQGKLSQYLGRASQFYPHEEFRAQLYQRFVRRMTDEQMVAAILAAEAQLSMEYLPTWMGEAVELICEGAKINAREKSTQVDENTIKYIEYRAVRNGSIQDINQQAVDFSLAQRIIQRSNRWQQRFVDSIAIERSHAAEYYRGLLGR